MEGVTEMVILSNPARQAAGEAGWGTTAWDGVGFYQGFFSPLDPLPPGSPSNGLVGPPPNAGFWPFWRSAEKLFDPKIDPQKVGPQTPPLPLRGGGGRVGGSGRPPLVLHKQTPGFYSAHSPKPEVVRTSIQGPVWDGGLDCALPRALP